MKKILYLIPLIMMIWSCNDENSNKKDAKKDIKQYTVEQFMNNVRVMGSSFSPDESKILFSTNETGIVNAFEIERDGKNKRQITKSEKESTYSVSYFPNDERILLSADGGGNEIYHIFLREENGEIKDLTPDSSGRASFTAWARDQKSFYYTSTKRDPRYPDLYKMTIENMESELIYTNEEGYNTRAISEDGKFIALVKDITRDNADIYIYNNETKETKLITEHEGDINFSASQFSLDGKFLYYLTNENSEFKYLKKYNIETGESEDVYKADRGVRYAYFSHNEKYFVIGINQDAKTIVKVFINNGSRKEIDFPKFEDGDLTSVNISKSEKYMTFYLGNSSSPRNLYVYNFENKTYKQLTNSQNPEIETDDLVIGEVIRYKSFDGLEIPAILYKPKSASKDNKVPAMVMVHGGPGGQARIGYRPLTQCLVNNGYAVIDVNNRGSSGYGKTFYGLDDRKHGNHDLKDCIYAKPYLASKDWIDSTKIGIIGGSYGGYMTAAALCFTPEEFDVGVNIFGVTNWIRTLKSIPVWWESQRKGLYKEIGDPVADSAYLYKISPLFHAENITKPFMVLQGKNDPRVLKVESDEIVAAAEKNGIPVEYVVFDDEGHGFRKKENEIIAYGKILKFLDKYLKGEKK